MVDDADGTIESADSNKPDVIDKRDNAGRFKIGSRYPGQKQNQMRSARYRRAIYDAISDEDMTQLARVMFGLAIAGDVPAARVLLEYAIGKPTPIENEIETYEQDGSIVINLVPAKTA